MDFYLLLCHLTKTHSAKGKMERTEKSNKRD